MKAKQTNKKHIWIHLVFGGCLAASAGAQDFNNDGYDDLVIGVPNAEVGGDEEAGTVFIAYGSSSGASSVVQELNQDSAGVTGYAEEGDRFGHAIACGDFDGDGYCDLAVGIPNEDTSKTDDGAVQIFYGSWLGLVPSTSHVMWEGNIGASGAVAEKGDHFGWALAAGDIDNDGCDDLVIGEPYEDVGSREDAGAIIVLFGSEDDGLTDTESVRIHQETDGIRGDSEAGDNFGYAVATGMFNKGSHCDIAIGVPGESIGDYSGCGAFAVLYGSADGPRTDNDKLVYRSRDDVAGVPGSGDGLGRTLATGKLNGDSYDDLAVGCQYDNVNGEEDAGSVNVMYGSKIGLTTDDDQIWHQDRSGIPNSAEEYDDFGCALAIGDFDNDGYGELVIGIRREDLGSDENCGAIQVIESDADGLSAASNKFITQDSTGVSGGREGYDKFGHSLTVGDWNGNGVDDLAVGAPYEVISGWSAGAVNVIYGGDDGLGSESGDMFYRGHHGIPGSLGYSTYGEQLGESLGVAR